MKGQQHSIQIPQPSQSPSNQHQPLQSFISITGHAKFPTSSPGQSPNRSGGGLPHIPNFGIASSNGKPTLSHAGSTNGLLKHQSSSIATKELLNAASPTNTQYQQSDNMMRQLLEHQSTKQYGIIHFSSKIPKNMKQSTNEQLYLMGAPPRSKHDEDSLGKVSSIQQSSKKNYVQVKNASVFFPPIGIQHSSNNSSSQQVNNAVHTISNVSPQSSNHFLPTTVFHAKRQTNSPKTHLRQSGSSSQLSKNNPSPKNAQTQKQHQKTPLAGPIHPPRAKREVVPLNINKCHSHRLISWPESQLDYLYFSNNFSETRIDIPMALEFSGAYANYLIPQQCAQFNKTTEQIQHTSPQILMKDPTVPPLPKQTSEAHVSAAIQQHIQALVHQQLNTGGEVFKVHPQLKNLTKSSAVLTQVNYQAFMLELKEG